MFGSSLFLGILHCDIRIKDFLSILIFKMHTLLNYVSHNWNYCATLTSYYNYELVKQGLNCNIQSGVKLCKDEIIVVMEKMGLRVNYDEDCIVEFDDQEEISHMFENGVSLEEVKEAFNVFDENKDGFIEATELQRVLCCLGFQRDFVECQKMINVVDQNGDELVDHYEFVKLMEQSFG
ncbi:probable calcium-binding protein CML45 [Cicer arietinum]|uniref:Probable calcium-binding protein CML30 n=1 Tax=Cicer arietinum TaxID=3827 RepID=A0A1S3ECF5_CICAR|nr:probable calcium-binding protein CML30 [Cicer arietinum]